MTRIISGSAKGTRLDVPPTGTRPTSERVREALFSALDAADAIEDARVLDLFAGTGALGLEALSRGARSVDLVEKAAAAASIAQRNAKRVTAVTSGVAQVHRLAAASFLGSARGEYDLVLIDPPYDLGDQDLHEIVTLTAPCLSPEALVLIERARRSPEPIWPSDLAPVRHRAYGDTLVWWAQPRTESQSR